MKPKAFFYLLVIYVFLQFGWWAYLLFDLNKEIYLITSHGDVSTLSTTTNDPLLRKLHEKWWMIGGEGAVFLGLLFWGIRTTKKAIDSEILLARQHQNFLLSVTHELKSPLASVMLNLQTLQKHQLDHEKKELLLKHAVEDTTRLNNLIENMLFATRLENQQEFFRREDENLSEMLTNQIQNYKAQRSPNHIINAEIEPEIFLSFDRIAFSSMIINLLENAEKYSPVGSTISVRLATQYGRIMLSVSDEGYGIPESEKQNIFRIFYRIGNEETRKTKGTGLGLYIVKKVVDAHQGRITVSENNPKGTVFVITF